MKVLLTGFEPFGGSPINPSIQAARAIAEMRLEGIDLSTTLLPVDRISGPTTLVLAVETFRPAAVLCLGQTMGRAALSIERVAINLLDFSIADNAGVTVTDEPIVPNGPAAYFATLPVRQMLAAVRDAGVPAELSLSAGTFLCNQVLYSLLHHLAVNGMSIPAGFIHLPALPEQVAGRTAITPSMSLDTMIAGVSAALRSIAS
ncbi:MAG: pyroglutamyl-peptidase I [Chloroflexi bacterium]|nr:pyroglutamyl-peptidase I [Chloroflexota bacterium]